MYVGTASGITRRRSSTSRPGKRYMVMIHAVPAPTTRVIAATPSMTISVVDSALGRIVRTRCGHVSKPEESASTMMAATGSATSATMRATAIVQPGET